MELKISKGPKIALKFRDIYNKHDFESFLFEE